MRTRDPVISPGAADVSWAFYGLFPCPQHFRSGPQLFPSGQGPSLDSVSAPLQGPLLPTRAERTSTARHRCAPQALSPLPHPLGCLHVPFRTTLDWSNLRKWVLRVPEGRGFALHPDSTCSLGSPPWPPGWSPWQSSKSPSLLVFTFRSQAAGFKSLLCPLPAV